MSIAKRATKLWQDAVDALGALMPWRPPPPGPRPEAPEWLLLGGLVGWSLVLMIPGLRILTDLPIYGDDHSSHMVAVRALLEHIKSGNSDIWCSTYNLGFPMYLYYQPLAHLSAAGLHLVSFGLLSPQLAFNATIVIVWTLYPLTTYIGTRRLGLDKTTALVCALCAPLVSSKFTFGFTVHSLMGLGLYTQHYAMLLFPLALGTLWQALRVPDADGPEDSDAPRPRPRRVIAASGLLVLVCLSHAFYGVVLATSGVLMVLAQPRTAFFRRTARLCAIGALTAVSLTFWIVPLLRTHHYAGGWPWGGVDRWQGYGVARVAKALALGQIFDNGHLPALTLGIVVGLVVIVFRWQRRAVLRALATCFALFVFFLMGRRTFGHLVDVQPLNLGLQLFRYIGAVHAFGVVLAGIGLAALGRYIARRAPPWSAVLVVSALLTWPLVKEIVTAGSYFRTVEVYDLVRSKDLIALGSTVDARVARGTPPGRVYAHGKSGTGSHLVAGLIGRYTKMAIGQSYGVGMHDSLGFYYLEYLYPTNQALMRLYNFRFAMTVPKKKLHKALERRGRKPLLKRRRVLLYELPGDYGYFTTGDVAFALRGRPKEIRPLVRRWLRSSLVARGAFGRVLHAPELVAPDLRLMRLSGKRLQVQPVDRSKPRRALRSFAELLPAASSQPTARPGRVSDVEIALTRYSARVKMKRAGALVLKVNYHPYWHVVVDGKRRAPMMVTPSFLAVSLDAGQHRVSFRFVRPTYVKLLWAATALMWLLLLALPALLDRRRRRNVSEKLVNQQSAKVRAATARDTNAKKD